MKTKRFSLFLSLSLVLLLLLAGTESSFAGATALTYDKNPAVMQAAEDTDTSDIVVSATNINGDTAAPIYSTIQYSASNMAYVKVSIPKAGIFNIDIWAGAAGAAGLYTSIDESAEEIKAIKLTASDGTMEDYVSLNAKVSKAGTYYLVFASSAVACQSAFRVYYAPAGGTLTKGTTFYGTSLDGKYAYYKVTASANGYLTISFPAGAEGDYSTYNVKLMNSDKSKNLFTKAVTVNYDKDFKTYAGVKKGTYYIAVKTSEDYYGIKVKFTKVSENSGSTKSKAKSISKGNIKKGIITAAQSSTSGDWYKFTISKSQKVNFSIKTLSSDGGQYGGLKVTFYASGNNYGSSAFKLNYVTPSDIINLYTNSSTKLAPGTYYIKVQKYAGGNGYYSLQWQ